MQTTTVAIVSQILDRHTPLEFVHKTTGEDMVGCGGCLWSNKRGEQRVSKLFAEKHLTEILAKNQLLA